jgi:hypothetical protein
MLNHTQIVIKNQRYVNFKCRFYYLEIEKLNKKKTIKLLNKSLIKKNNFFSSIKFSYNYC